MSPATMQSWLAQRLEDDAVWAGVAELRRLARRRGGFRTGSLLRMRRTRGTSNSPNRYISGFPLDGDARGADGFDQVRIAFLDHHAALDALRKLRDLAHRQRMREAQLEHAGLRRRFARVHEGNPGSDDAQRLGRPAQPGSTRSPRSIPAFPTSFWRNRRCAGRA